MEITEKYLKEKMKENMAHETKMAKLKKLVMAAGFVLTAVECAVLWLICGRALYRGEKMCRGDFLWNTCFAFRCIF